MVTDYLTIILPTVLASIVTFAVLGIKKLGSASEGTLSGTIKLENVQTNVTGLEKKMEKGFERIEELIKTTDTENRHTFNKVWESLEEVRSDIRLSAYRIDQVERKRNGGDKAAI